ncbi:MAG: sodium:solute symporter family protein [Burkholderiaceae bacterium]|nr:sodium:solute symporter family protein [Burkholderiaceae bacterium]
MLVWLVLVYLVLTILIALYAARRVHNSKDFLIAGRSLPLYMNTATVFATWFGAETVLSVSATFSRDGLSGIPADPFGASFSLILFGLLFARVMYRMDLLTIGDYYRQRFGKSIEVITSLSITLSYLGWTSAQLTALGLVFYVLSGGAISLSTGILLGAGIVIFYTLFGGMWSLALTDLIQTIVIVIGLLLIAGFVGDLAGGPSRVIEAARTAGKLDPWPTGDAKAWIAYGAAFLTMALGSIPQQDVFQRVTSARNEKTAVRGTVLGAVAYFCFAFVPMFIAFSAIVIDPSFADLFKSEDEREIQRILPELILNRTPLWAQVMFFGALLSAILSTSSGALLAPTALFTENVLRPFMPRISDRRFLMLLRTVLVLFCAGATAFALNSRSTMYQMIQQAYSVTLVGALVPLAAGVYWRRATVQGALLSIMAGIATWLSCLNLYGDTLVPPQLIGLAAAIAGMLIGSLGPQLFTERRPHSAHLKTDPRTS